MQRNGNSLEPIAPSKLSWREFDSGFLPGKMNELLEAMKAPFSAADFALPGMGLLGLKKKYPKIAGECSGCFVLIENGKPVYVGMSRKVYKRLFFLLKQARDYTSTLADMLAHDKVPLEGCWYDKMQTPGFKAAYEEAKERMKRMQVAVVEVKGDMELYIFAAYCAQHLKIPMINLFRLN